MVYPFSSKRKGKCEKDMEDSILNTVYFLTSIMKLYKDNTDVWINFFRLIYVPPEQKIID